MMRRLDRIDGSHGDDTIAGGAGNDTIDAGTPDDAALDTLYGEDGDDSIKAVNTPASADIVNCGPGSEDEATVDTLDAEDPLGGVEDRCENVLAISERSGERAEGYFDKEGNHTHVEFESYVDTAEGGFLPETDPNRHPYDRGTTFVITLDDDTLAGDEDRIEIKLTVNPETKTIKQRVTTAQGASKKVSDADRRAILRAGDMLQRTLDRKGRGDCDMKNQETLVLRHFALLSETSRDQSLNDLDRTYQDPGNKCDSNNTNGGSGSTNLSVGEVPEVSSASISAGDLPAGVGTKRCVADTSGKARSSEAGLAELSRSAKPAPMLAQYIPLQYYSNGDDGITILPCDSSTNYGSYYDYYGNYGSSDAIYGPASGYDIGRCGPSGYPFLEYAYTQDCLDHDICVGQLEASAFDPFDDDCGEEFAEAADDFAVGYALSPIGCDPFTSSASSFGTRSRSSPTAEDPDHILKKA